MNVNCCDLTEARNIDMDGCNGSLDIIVATRIVSLLVGRFTSPKMDAEISFMRRAYSVLLRRARV